MSKSEVAEWYKGQHILLTGATGFMGIVFVEKLLRSCPDLAALYLLIRPKKDKNPKTRLEEYLKDEVFEALRKSDRGDIAFKKLVLIEGDVTKNNCGISKENLKLLQEEVTLVLHTAADVRFVQPIKNAVQRNVAGTRNVLDLACTFKKIKVFVYVSTTFCQCHERVLEEKVYEPRHNPRKIIDLVSWLDEDALQLLAPYLYGKNPNAYAFSKNLAEGLIEEYADKLPLVIARPPMVISAYKDPIPGWSNNVNGPMGVIAAGTTGVLRVMHAYPEYNNDVIPVDMLNNSILLIAWKRGKEQLKSSVEVYNITLAEKNHIKIGKFLEYCRKYAPKYPPSMMLWYPDGTTETNAVMYKILVFLKHTVPAYLIDLLIPLTGNKFSMKKLQKRIKQGLDLLSYYSTRHWYFKNENFGNIYKSLNDTDRATFYTDLEEFDWDYYMEHFIKQLRTHINNDTPDTIPRAQKLHKRLYYIHNTVQVLFWMFIFLMLYFIIQKFIQ